jgi:NhaC family Na+:H+ antiporter
MSTDPPVKGKTICEPSLLDALIPLIFMVGLLVASIVLFGLDAAVGLLQVALCMSAVVAAVVAHKNGHSWEKLGEEIVKGISLAMSAILILLMVGALIGIYNMFGTIGTMVSYGIKYIDPSWFYLAMALPLFLGFFWVLWDSKRQGWHDKIAGTQVLYIPKNPHK